MLLRLGNASGSWDLTHPSVRYYRVMLKHKPVEASYTIHSQTFKMVEFTKYLTSVLPLTPKLNFNNHIDSAVKKVNGTRAFQNCNLRSCSHSITETQPIKRTSDRWLSMLRPSGILIPTVTSTNWRKFNVTQLVISPVTTTTPAATLQCCATLNDQRHHHKRLTML